MALFFTNDLSMTDIVENSEVTKKRKKRLRAETELHDIIDKVLPEYTAVIIDKYKDECVHIECTEQEVNITLTSDKEEFANTLIREFETVIANVFGDRDISLINHIFRTKRYTFDETICIEIKKKR